jgi:hypothetical protein
MEACYTTLDHIVLVVVNTLILHSSSIQGFGSNEIDDLRRGCLHCN